MPRTPPSPSPVEPAAGASSRPSSAAKRFSPDDVRMGHINGVFGLRGEVRLFLYNPASELIGARLDVILVDPSGGRREVEIAIRPGSGRRILGRIAGVSSPEEAAALKDHELVLPADQLPEAGEGEWYFKLTGNGWLGLRSFCNT